jgi:hypothetical protein
MKPHRLYRNVHFIETDITVRTNFIVFSVFSKRQWSTGRQSITFPWWLSQNQLCKRKYIHCVRASFFFLSVFVRNTKNGNTYLKYAHLSVELYIHSLICPHRDSFIFYLVHLSAFLLDFFKFYAVFIWDRSLRSGTENLGAIEEGTRRIFTLWVHFVICWKWSCGLKLARKCAKLAAPCFSTLLLRCKSGHLHL